MPPFIYIALVSLAVLGAGTTGLLRLHLSGWWELLVVPVSLVLGMLGAMRDEDAEP
jgi:hypothetical protein